MEADAHTGVAPSRPPLDSTDRVTASIQTLFRLGGSRRIHAQQVGAAGITLSQQALRVLERTLEHGSTTPGQLAAALDLDPAVVTRLLRQLEEGRLVHRRRSPHDGRVNTVEATEAGRAAFLRYREVIWGQVRRALAAWPPEDLDLLSGLLGRLVADVQKEPYRPVARLTPPGRGTPPGGVTPP